MTKKRQMLLDILRSRECPENASQIYKSLVNKSMDLATVYRGLEYLEKAGYAQSFVFECDHRGIERYYYVNKMVHEFYIHCEWCHRFFSLGDCPLDPSLKEIEKSSGFTILDHQLILKGICQNCQEGTKK